MPNGYKVISVYGLSTTTGYGGGVVALASAFSNNSSNFIWNPDAAIRPFNIGIGCVSSGNTYNIEHSFDYTGSSAFTSSNATWFQNSTISGATGNLTGNYAFPVAAIRLNVTAGSSTGLVTATLIQAG